MFDWDEGNIAHIALHDISPNEVVEVIGNHPIDLVRQDRNGEERFQQIGETRSGRVLVVVTTIRGSLIRVVTAFPANRAYREFYAEQKRSNPSGKSNSS
jgi:uncharacterized DUF497 family protein